MTNYYAGMDIDAPCGRCKLETKHRVLSVTDGIPEKLICVSCNSIHKFKPERVKAVSPAGKVVRPPRAATTPRQTAVSPSNFQNLMIEEKAGTIAKPYGQGISWDAGMWVDHPAFGLGKIQHKSGRKLTVLFREGVKTLVAL